MFTSNSAREISYIFLWLFGIIAFYVLVNTYLLEPKSTQSSTQEIHSIMATVDAIKEKTHNKSISPIEMAPSTIKNEYIVINTVDTTVPVMIKTDVKVEKVTVSSSVVPVKPKVSIPSIPVASPTVPMVTLVSIPNTPSVPKVPSVPTVVTATSLKKSSIPSDVKVELKAIEVQAKKLQEAIIENTNNPLLESARKLVKAK